MVAVILGESEGDPRAHNANTKTGDDSYGLTQVNMIGNLGAARREQYGIKNEDLFDAATNLRIAYDIYEEAGYTFRPWGAYNHGGYRKYGRYELAEEGVKEAFHRPAPRETPKEVRHVPTYDPPSGYTSAIPKGTQALREALAAHFGFTRTEVIRDRSRCQQKSSEHCVCRGIDLFTTDLKLGRQVFEWCVANADLGIQSVIFNRRVWGFGNWNERHYSPSGNATIEHRDHVHVGVNKRGATTLTRAVVEARLKGKENVLAGITEERFKAVEDALERIEAILYEKDKQKVKALTGRATGDIATLAFTILEQVEKDAS